jgi:hypothetical protein
MHDRRARLTRDRRAAVHQSVLRLIGTPIDTDDFSRSTRLQLNMLFNQGKHDEVMNKLWCQLWQEATADVKNAMNERYVEAYAERVGHKRKQRTKREDCAHDDDDALSWGLPPLGSQPGPPPGIDFKDKDVDKSNDRKCKSKGGNQNTTKMNEKERDAVETKPSPWPLLSQLEAIDLTLPPRGNPLVLVLDD